MEIKERLIANAEQPVGWVVGFIAVLTIVGYIVTSISTNDVSPFVGAGMFCMGSTITFAAGLCLKRERDKESGK